MSESVSEGIRRTHICPFAPKRSPRENIIGCTIRGWYDGVAYWQCARCGMIWDRAGKRHRTSATVPHPIMGEAKLLGAFKS